MGTSACLQWRVWATPEGLGPCDKPAGPARQAAACAAGRTALLLLATWARCRNHEGGKRKFEATMDQVDQELGAAGGPFFLGQDLSLVDIVFVPFLERIVASIVYYNGLVVRGQGCVPPLLPCLGPC